MKKLTSVMMLLLLFVATNMFAQNTGSVKFKFNVHSDYYGWDLNNLKGARLLIHGNNIDRENPIIIEGEENQDLILSNLQAGDYWAIVQQYPLGYETVEDEMGNIKEELHFYVQQQTTNECHIPCKQIEGIKVKVIDGSTSEAISGIPFHIFSHITGINEEAITNEKGEINITNPDPHMVSDFSINCLSIPNKYLLISGELHSHLQYRPEDGSSREIRLVFEEKPSCQFLIRHALVDEYNEFTGAASSGGSNIEDLSGLIIGLYDSGNNLVHKFYSEDILWDDFYRNYRLYYNQEGNYKIKIEQNPKGFKNSEILRYRTEFDVTFEKRGDSYAYFYVVGINSLNINALDINTNEPVEDAQFRVIINNIPHYKRTTDRHGKTVALELSYETESVKCVTVPMGYQLVGTATQALAFDKSFTPVGKNVTYYFEQVGPTQQRDTCNLKVYINRAIDQTTITSTGGSSTPIAYIDKPFGSIVKLYDDAGKMVGRVDYDEQYANGLQTDYLLFDNIRAGKYYAKVERYTDGLERFTECLDSEISRDSLACSTGTFIIRTSEWQTRWHTGVGKVWLFGVGRDSLKIKAMDYNTNESLENVWFSAFSEKYGKYSSRERHCKTNTDGELFLQYQTFDTFKVVNDSCPEGYRLVGNPTQNVNFIEGSPSLRELTYYFVKIKEAPQLLGHIQANLPTTHMYSVKTGEPFQVYAWLSDATDTGIGLYDQNGNFLEDITQSRSGNVYTCNVANRTGSFMIYPYYLDEMGDKKSINRPENSYLIDKLPLAVEINWNTRNYVASEDVSQSKSLRIRTSVNNLHRVENEETFRLSLNITPASNDVQMGLFDLWGNFQENILRSKSGANYVCAVSWDIWGDDYIVMPYIMENGSMKIVERVSGEPVIDRLPLYVDDGFGSFSVRNAMGVESSNAKSNISFYPNPVRDKITVNTNETIKRIQVLDINSKLLLSVDSESSEIDLSSLNRGVYILKVITDKSVKSFKMNKE